MEYFIYLMVRLVGLGFRRSDHFVRDSLVLIGPFMPFGCEAT